MKVVCEDKKINSMNLPTITVVTPSLNHAEYIEQTIQSVLNQNYPKPQYIVIDGGSSDKSVDIIREYEENIDYWISEPDRGQSDAINKGLRYATGDIVCWLNSDDLLMPNTLIEVGRAFMENPSIEVVTGYTLYVDRQLRILYNHYTPCPKSWLAKRGVLYFGPLMFWKKDLLNRIGYLDENLHYCMDCDLWMRFHSVKVNVFHIRKILSVWRFHEMCKSNTRGKLVDKERLMLRDRYRDMHYLDSVGWAKLVYRAWKVFNGDYLKQWLFKCKWKGRLLNELIESIEDGTP